MYEVHVRPKLTTYVQLSQGVYNNRTTLIGQNGTFDHSLEARDGCQCGMIPSHQ